MNSFVSVCSFLEQHTVFEYSVIIFSSLRLTAQQRWRRKWQLTPVFLPGASHGQRSLAGYSPWGHKESDMTEQLHSLTHTVERELCVLQHEIHNKEVFPGPLAATLIPLAQSTENKMNYMPDTVLGTLCAEKTCEEENYDQFA